MPKTEMDHFDKINQYYSEYYSLLGQENVESAIKALRDKIIIEVCRIFYLDENGQYIPDDCDGHDKKKENKEYSYEIFMKILECLKYYNPIENKGSFAAYVVKSVNKKLNSLKEKGSIIPDFSVSDNIIDNISKIEELDLYYKSNIPNESKRMQIIKQDLKLSDETFKTCIRIMNEKKVLSLNAPVGDGAEDKIEDFVGDGSQISEDFVGDGSQFSTEFRLVSKLKLIEILDCIQEQWQEEKSQAILKDLLTKDILESSNPSLDYDKYRDTLKKYEFINQDMVENFFTDRSYKLPTLEEIGVTHGGMTTSGVCKILPKFLKKLKDKISSI